MTRETYTLNVEDTDTLYAKLKEELKNYPNKQIMLKSMLTMLLFSGSTPSQIQKEETTVVQCLYFVQMKCHMSQKEKSTKFLVEGIPIESLEVCKKCQEQPKAQERLERKQEQQVRSSYARSYDPYDSVPRTRMTESNSRNFRDVIPR